MNKDEALRLALEAFEEIADWYVHDRSVGALADSMYEASCLAKVQAAAIKAALSGEAQTRSVVKDEPVAHSVVAGALFDFMGWLTSREKRLILSSVDEASPAVEAITEFAKKRNLSLKYAEVGYWMEFLSTPPQQEAKDEPDYKALWQQMCERCDELDKKLAQRKPLTDEQAMDAYFETPPFGTYKEAFIAGIRFIEAAHGIKGEA